MKEKKENLSKVKIDLNKPPKGKTKWDYVDALTDKQIEAAAKTDVDNPPLSKKELDKFQEVIDVRKIRHKLKLSQTQFANRYKLSKRIVEDWEQHRRIPNGPSRVLLIAIKNAPELVRKAIAKG